MGVIELGLVTDAGQEPLESLSRPIRHGDLRRILLAAIALLCLFGVTASALPVSHAPRQLWTVPFRDGSDGFTVTPEAVYVLSTMDGSLTAYASHTGEVLWSSTELGGASWVGAVESGVMLLPAEDTTVQVDDPEGGGSYYRQFTRRTVAVDAATGRHLWRQPGDFAASADGLVLLVEWNDDGTSARTLRVVRLRDGSPVWDRPGGGLETWVAGNGIGAGSDRLVTVTDSGATTVYDLTNGREVASGRLPWNRQDRGDGTYTNISAEGHRLYLENVVDQRGTVSAYDTETLGKLWQIDTRSYGGFTSCGPVLCISTPLGTTGYDRDTGHLRWSRADAANVYPITGGLLVVDEQNGGRRTLIDAGSGVAVIDMGTATLVWDYTSADDMPYLVSHTEEPAGRMAVSRLDSRTRHVRLLGTIDAISENSCQSAATILACVAAGDGRLAVTDVG
ncbi:PQQ-binding-like beta-propeller repeat protein [Actinoplanes sp. NPDC049316]|uniref:outer membrane protein assembly factor BamB family protein n=1 Tax=Actinoplanes sp. NPDC049316 TaxID=3154727 RepID=UPI0034342354